MGHPLFWRRVSAGAFACAGATCEDVLAPCAGGPCKNGGECQESEDYESFSCSCPSGWQGRGMAQLGVQQISSRGIPALLGCLGSERWRGGSGAREQQAGGCLRALPGGSSLTWCPASGRVLTCPGLSQVDGTRPLPAPLGEGGLLRAVPKMSSSPGLLPAPPAHAVPVPLCPAGQTCEIDINECVKSPCRNGATCQNTNGSYRCACRTGFSGRNCDTDIDDCKPSKSRGQSVDRAQPGPEPSASLPLLGLGHSSLCTGEPRPLLWPGLCCKPCSGFRASRARASRAASVQGQVGAGGRVTCRQSASVSHVPSLSPAPQWGQAGLCLVHGLCPIPRHGQGCVQGQCCRAAPGQGCCTGAGPLHLHMHVPPLQIRATMVAPAPMVSACSSASAWLVSVGPSARRTSMSVPATPARTVPTAPTASTATPAPAPLASAASTARTTRLTARRGTAQRGSCRGRSLCQGWSKGPRSLRCPIALGQFGWALAWSTTSGHSQGCDVCVPSSCFNGGTCVDGINTFTCVCPPGFTGSYCEHNINECDSKPCLNGGTCQDSYGTYKCTCPQGYTGLNCQVEEPWAVSC